MRKPLFILVTAAVLIALPLLNGHGDEPKSKTSELMQKKLVHSQKILEGIALNDFEKIAKNAEELIQISKTAQWRVIDTPRYQVFSNDFRNIAETLIQNSKDRNIDAAALSYVDLTLSCVKCHKHVRETRMGE